MDIWNKHSLNNGESLGLQIGPMDLWIKRSSNEWLVGWIRNSNIDVLLSGFNYAPKILDNNPPDLTNWNRWVADPNDKEVKIMPSMPNRSVVVRPIQSLRVSAGRSAKVYAKIPIWVQIIIKSKNKSPVLCEIPVVELSNTWFGDPLEGELCYSMSNYLDMDIPSNPLDPHCAICPIQIKNQSVADELNLDRICLHVPFLTLYNSQNHLWTNEIQVTFKDMTKVSDLHYTGKAPNINEPVSQICGSREQYNTGLLKRTFSNFTSWTYG